EFDFDSGRQFFGRAFLQLLDVDLLGRHEINSISVDLDYLRALFAEPLDHLLQQIAPNLCHPRGGVEVGKVSLSESEIAVKAVDQNLEGVLERFQVALLGWVLGRAHFCLRFQPKFPQIGQQMSKDLQSITRRKAIELKHDGRIKRSDVAMPDIALHSGKEKVG